MPNRITRSTESSRSQRIVDSMRVLAHGVTHRDGGELTALGNSIAATNIIIGNVINKLRGTNNSPITLDLNPQDCFQVPLAPPGPRGKQGLPGKQGPPGLDFIHDGLDVPLGPPGQRGLTGLTGATGAAGPAGKGSASPAPLFLGAFEDELPVGNFPQPNNRPNLPMWSMGVNEDGTSLSNWFQLLGSWSVVSSAFFVNTGATTFAHLSWSVKIPHSSFMLSADVKIESTGGFAADNRVGFRFHSDGTTGTNGSAVFLRSSGALTPASTGGIYSENPFGVTAGAHLSNNFSLDTYYNLKVVVTGRIMDIYVDNVYKTSRTLQPGAQPPATLETGVIGLCAYNCKADFKNVKMWSLNTATTVTAGGTTYSPVNFSTQVMRNLCDGRLTLAAGYPLYNPEQKVHSATNTGTEVETVSGNHNWVNGTIIHGGGTIGGLTLNTIYYVHVVSATTMTFHTTVADAISGASPVNLTAAVIAWFPPTGVSSTSILFSPYKGNQIGLYNGTYWDIISFAETTLALGSVTSGKNYDVFAYNNGGVLALESLIWTDDFTRATALTTQDGIYVKSGATTRRYLGTFRANSTTTTIDSKQFRFVWNMYNREPRFVRKTDYTTTWTDSSATYRQANSVATNQVEVVVGMDVASIADLSVQVGATNPGSGGNKGVVTIGQDSISNPLQDTFGGRWPPAAASASYECRCQVITPVPLGYHYYTWLEAAIGGTGNVTFNGSDDFATNVTGIFGFING